MIASFFLFIGDFHIKISMKANAVKKGKKKPMIKDYSNPYINGVKKKKKGKARRPNANTVDVSN